jgi:predicted transcriptional regulator
VRTVRLKQMKLVRARIDSSKYPSEEIISLTGKGRKVAEKLKEIEEVLGGRL